MPIFQSRYIKYPIDPVVNVSEAIILCIFIPFKELTIPLTSLINTDNMTGIFFNVLTVL